jgi:hypothetical protein
VGDPQRDTRKPTEAQTFLAPSWSLASVPHGVCFNYHHAVRTGAVQRQLDIVKEDIDTIEATIEPYGSDAYSIIKSGKLRMRFCVTKAFLKIPGKSRYHQPHLDVCDDRTRQPVAVFLPDYLEYIQKFGIVKEQEGLCLLLGYAQRDGEFNSMPWLLSRCHLRSFSIDGLA